MHIEHTSELVRQREPLSTIIKYEMQLRYMPHVLQDNQELHILYYVKPLTC